MLDWITLRRWYLLVAIACAGLLGTALYFQYAMYMEPCPLCIFQRVAFLFIGLVALLAALFYPRRLGQRVFTALIVLGGIAGAAVAGRHFYLQNLPPGEVPECGPGLSYMLETAPFFDVMKTVLVGDGNCAEVQWSFLGLSMPGWTFVWYVGLALATVWFTRAQGRREGVRS